MSIVRIDSFARINENPPVVIGAAQTWNALLMSGYPSTNVSNSASGYFVASPDPLDAARPAITIRRGATGTPTTSFYPKFAIPVPNTNGDPWVIGFSAVFHSAAFAVGGTSVALGASTGQKDTGDYDPTNMRLFIVRAGMRHINVYDGITEVTQNPSFVLSANVRYFFEIRFNPVTSELNVYVDDELVGYTLRPLSIPYVTLTALAAVNSSNPPAGTQYVSIADIYVLVEDDVAPNSRLGASTRVVPVRPSGDASPNDFVPPSGVVDNYEVAAQRINLPIPEVLSAGNLPATDMYDTTIPDTAAGASAVHAVALRSVAFNVDTSEHDIAMKVRQGDSGTLETFGTPTPVAPGSGLVYSEHISPINPSTGLAWTATDLASLDIGVTVED